MSTAVANTVVGTAYSQRTGFRLGLKPREVQAIPTAAGITGSRRWSRRWLASEALFIQKWHRFGGDWRHAQHGTHATQTFEQVGGDTGCH